MIDPAVRDLIAEAVHGAETPPLECLIPVFDQLGIVFPTAVVVVSGEQVPVGMPGIVLAIHPGQRFVIGDAEALIAALRDSGLAHGAALPVDTPDRLIAVMQLAIVSMREAVLVRSRERRGEDPDFADEQELGGLLLRLIRDGDEAWADTVRIWIETVLWRHRRHLNTIRRKLIECFTACTRDHDAAFPVGNALEAAVRQVGRAYSPDDLRQAAQAGLERLQRALAAEAAPRSVRSPLLRAALEWVEVHHLDPISLADAAAAVGVSPTHLAHLCRRELGCTILERIHALRLEHAKDRLRNSRDGILTIALASGFPSVEHFHRCFRRATGTTPRRYRIEER